MKTKKLLYCFSALLFYVLLFCCGCGRNNIPSVAVDLDVVYKGVAVDGALVVLTPTEQDGELRTASGFTDSAGKARISFPGSGKDGVMEGTYKVVIIKSSTIGGNVTLVQDDVDKPKEATPMKYIEPKHQLPVKYANENTTDLKITVKKDGENRWSFELKD